MKKLNKGISAILTSTIVLSTIQPVMASEPVKIQVPEVGIESTDLLDLTELIPAVPLAPEPKLEEADPEPQDAPDMSVFSMKKTRTGEVGKILTVPSSISASVSNGTSLEDAISKLPTSVNIEVEDLSAIETIEGKTFDFEDNTKPAEWNVLSDLITFENGKMNFPKHENVKATLGTEDMENYVVEVTLQSAEETTTADFGVMFRTTNATADGPDSYTGYYVGLGVLDFNQTPAKTGIKIGYANGDWNDIKMIEHDIDVNVPNTLKIVVFEDKYSVYVKPEGGEYEFVAEGTQTLNETGTVGLRSYKQAFNAEDFILRGVTAEDIGDISRTKTVTADIESWAEVSYDGNTAGSYDFVGTLANSSEYTNTDNLTVSATVNVKEALQTVAVDHSVPFSQVTLDDGFFKDMQKQFILEVVPTGMTNIQKTGGGLNNFKKASEYLATKEGENYTTYEDAPKHEGAKYVDSDVFKVIESMAYALQIDPQGDAEIIEGQAFIAEKLEEWIPWFVGSQEADGYYYTAFTLDSNNGDCPDTQMRFTGRKDDMPIKTDGTHYDTVGTEAYNDPAQGGADYDDHELYAMGHFYEAAVAHYRATGDVRLLDVAIKNADLVLRTFGHDDATQVQGVPGHQEIELALIKLAQACTEVGTLNGVDYAVKSSDYIALSKFFLDERGHDETRDGWNDAADNKFNTGYAYAQDDVPVDEMRTVYGHAVRAGYTYAAMADVALMEVANGNANPYDTALNSMWNDMLTKQYINGGVGVHNGQEAFGAPYELPNHNAYCETCAQVAMTMWGSRMSVLYDDSRYADNVETMLYNTIISGVNFDGDKFFYGNPMQSDNGGLRSSWFGTACCPPNLMRTVMSVSGYIYNQKANGDITVNQYLANTAELKVGDTDVNVSLDTDMPWGESGTFTVNPAKPTEFEVRFRIPEWATHGNDFSVNGEQFDATPDANGYVTINRTWSAGDTVEMTIRAEAERAYSDPNVTTNDGLVALRYGPFIYAAESVDNNFDLSTAVLPVDAELNIEELKPLDGRTSGDPYGVESLRKITTTTTQQTPFGERTFDWEFIPYYAWGNRGTTQMRVYIKEEGETSLDMPLEYYARASANYTCNGDSPAEMNDGVIDTTDSGSNRWTSYASPTNDNWVEYAFDGNVTLSGSKITWYDDGGGVQVPDNVVIKYLNENGEWTEVTNLTNGDKFPKNVEQEYAFDEITTTKIRLYPTRQGMTSKYAQPGICEWKLTGYITNAEISKDALQSLYNEYVALEQGEYTDASWTTFQAEIILAKAVLDDAEATQLEVNEALADLKKAYEGLNVFVEYDPDNDNFIVHYSFGDNVGETNVLDKEGDFNGTLMNGASFDSSGSIIGGEAVKLENGGYISIPNEAIAGTEDEITFGAWVKLDSSATWQALLVTGSGQSEYAVLAAKGSPHGVACGVTMAIKDENGEEVRVKADTSNAVPAGEWAHVVYTQKGTTAKIYLNGIEVATTDEMTASLADTLQGSGADVRLGQNKVWPDPAMDGTVDEVKIYNKALTADEVLAEFNVKGSQINIEKIKDAKEMLTLGDTSDVEENLVLPNEIGNNVSVTWETSNEAYVTTDGKVKIPTTADGDQTVTLTATLTLGDLTEIKTFEITLKALTPETMLERDADYAYRYLEFIINDGQTKLPTEAKYGSEITWEVLSGNMEIRDNIVYKTEGALENEPVSLKVTVSNNGEVKSQEVTNLILKDAYVANLMSYFTNGDDSRGMKLSYSYDSKNFMPLNGGKAIIKPTIGSQRMRDPSLFRLANGEFGVVSTQGWDNPSIYFFDSPDLLTFENERLVDVATTDGTTSGEAELTNERAWAPEVNYDRVSDQYYVYWADPDPDSFYDSSINDKPMYYNTSKDLETFSEPGVYYSTGYRVIDASIKKFDGTYFMAIKDETKANGMYGTIFMASSDSLDPNSWKSAETSIAGVGAGQSVAEGPTISKSYQEEGVYYVFFDEFSGGGVTAIRNDDLSDDNGWVYDRTVQTAPSKVTGLDSADRKVSHCGITDVTQKELDRLIAEYGVTTTDASNIKYNVLDVITEDLTIETPKNSTTSDLDLPEKVTVKIDDGNIIEMPVTWEEKTITGNGAIKGTLTFDADVYKNTGNLEVIANVTVAESEEKIHAELYAEAKAEVENHTVSKFKLSLENTTNVSNISVTFETDGTDISVSPIDGYTVVNDNNGKVVDGMYEENFVFMAEDVSSLINVLEKIKIANVNVTGEYATLKIKSVQVTGIIDNTPSYGTYDIKRAEATYGTEHDINKDGIVDGLDIAAIQQHYQSTSADADWNEISHLDMNEDGKLDMSDIFEVYINRG